MNYEQPFRTLVGNNPSVEQPFRNFVTLQDKIMEHRSYFCTHLVILVVFVDKMGRGFFVTDYL